MSELVDHTNKSSVTKHQLINFGGNLLQPDVRWIGGAEFEILVALTGAQGVRCGWRKETEIGVEQTEAEV